jgi:hypothetical protein
LGYIDENGEFVFEPGFGVGLAGMPYDAKSPMGQFGPLDSGQKTRFGGVLPYWTRDPERREHVLLVFFERRANQSHKVPPGNFSERLLAVTTKLEAKRQSEMQKMRKRLIKGRDSKASHRLRFLEAQGEFTSWATRVLLDYFPYDEMQQSWDAGQCAYRHGDIDKILVKQLVSAVHKIGCELYPKPATPVETASSDEAAAQTTSTDLDHEPF